MDNAAARRSTSARTSHLAVEAAAACFAAARFAQAVTEGAARDWTRLASRVARPSRRRVLTSVAKPGTRSEAFADAERAGALGHCLCSNRDDRTPLANASQLINERYSVPAGTATGAKRLVT